MMHQSRDRCLRSMRNFRFRFINAEPFVFGEMLNANRFSVRSPGQVHSQRFTSAFIIVSFRNDILSEWLANEWPWFASISLNLICCCLRRRRCWWLLLLNNISFLLSAIRSFRRWSIFSTRFSTMANTEKRWEHSFRWQLSLSLNSKMQMLDANDIEHMKHIAFTSHSELCPGTEKSPAADNWIGNLS